MNDTFADDEGNLEISPNEGSHIMNNDMKSVGDRVLEALASNTSVIITRCCCVSMETFLFTGAAALGDQLSSVHCRLRRRHGATRSLSSSLHENSLISNVVLTV